MSDETGQTGAGTARVCVGITDDDGGCDAPARFAVSADIGHSIADDGLAGQAWVCGRHLTWVLDQWWGTESIDFVTVARAPR